METRILNGYKQFNIGNGWVFTHRAVAEKILGEKIPKGHEVHHKNGNKMDNRPENLLVLPAEEHRKLHARQQNASTPDALSIITGLDNYLLSTMVTVDTYKIESLALNSMQLQLELSTIDMKIMFCEKELRELEKNKMIFDNNESVSGQSYDQLQKNIEKRLEDLIAKKEILESQCKQASENMTQQINKISETYTNLLKNLFG